MTRDDLATLDRLLAPLRRRQAMAAVRGQVHAVDDAKKWQEVQAEGLAGQKLDGVEVLLPYGLTAHIPVGAEGVMLAVGADGARYVMLPLGDRRHRPTGLAPGEVMIHCDQAGMSVHLKAGGEIEIKAPTRFRIDVGGGANVLELTSAGTTWKTADFEATP